MKLENINFNGETYNFSFSRYSSSNFIAILMGEPNDEYPDIITTNNIAQNHDRFIATIDNTNHTNKRWYETEYSDTCVKIYLSHKRRYYKNNLTIYEVFINDKKCFISTDKLETELWLQNHKELWLNPKQRHKAFGVIHRAQNNEFENMRIETIVLDAYDQVIQKEE